MGVLRELAEHFPLDLQGLEVLPLLVGKLRLQKALEV